MNDKKLKPEHRKLWRRVYLNEFEVQNQSPEASEAMADKVVTQWEARGAFDETSVYNSEAWRIAAERLQAEHPEAFQAVYDALTKEGARL